MKSVRTLFLLLVSILIFSCKTTELDYNAIPDSEIVSLENVTLDGEHSICLHMFNEENHTELKNHIIKIIVFHDENLDYEIFENFNPDEADEGISYGLIYAKTDKHGWLKVQNISGYENFILEDEFEE